MGDMYELKNSSRTLDFHIRASGSDWYFCNQNKKIKHQGVTSGKDEDFRGLLWHTLFRGRLIEGERRFIISP